MLSASFRATTLLLQEVKVETVADQPDADQHSVAFADDDPPVVTPVADELVGTQCAH